MTRWIAVASLSLLVVATGAAVAADPPAPAKTPCADAAKSRQFDFWIGEWDVFGGESKAGTNSIRPILDGCVLQETWSGAKGSAGSSFNFYDPSRGEWRQLWVWRGGTTLELAGGFADGRMVLRGRSTGRDGAPVENRITWTAGEDGTVRQHWEVSKDGGENWATSFDGLYRKRS